MKFKIISTHNKNASKEERHRKIISDLRKYHGKEAVREYLKIIEEKNGHRNERIV